MMTRGPATSGTAAAVKSLDNHLIAGLVGWNVRNRLDYNREGHSGQAFEHLRQVVFAIRPQVDASLVPLIRVNNEVRNFRLVCLNYLKLFNVTAIGRRHVHGPVIAATTGNPAALVAVATDRTSRHQPPESGQRQRGY